MKSTADASSDAAVNKAVIDQLHAVKKCLAVAESMRSHLNELVGEFALADTPRRKVGVYNR